GRWQLLVAVEQRLEVAADGERDGLGGRDADRRAGLRVTAVALRAAALGEGAEAGIGEPRTGAVPAHASLDEVVTQLGEHAVDDVGDRLLGEPVARAALAVDAFDELLLGHPVTLSDGGPPPPAEHSKSNRAGEKPSTLDLPPSAA